VRFVARGPPERLASAIGMTLPTSPSQAITQNAHAALWLGPDEWLLIAPADAISPLRPTTPDGPAALVDVSHRNCGLIISGPDAARLLSAGCPLNLDPAAFPVGTSTRTLFGKAEIVLWRTKPETFRLEFWRSFAPYVAGLLSEALRDVD
jgi:sarcosine oxidase subunit gamma